MLLAIDTATDYGSVAIGEPGNVVTEQVFSKRTHAARLVPAIQKVLGEIGLKASELDGLIVADGPGSFTGLRIGFATAKGILCNHNKLQLYRTPSLMASAYGVRSVADGPVVALYDALRGDVFAAVYSFEKNKVECQIEPRLIRIDDLAVICSQTPKVAVGDGAICHAESVRKWIGRAPLGPPEYFPRAASLIDLYGLEGGKQIITSPTSYEPAYGRLAEAEARRKRAEKDQTGEK